MEHDDKPLPIDTRLLGALAEKVDYYFSWTGLVLGSNSLPWKLPTFVYCDHYDVIFQRTHEYNHLVDLQRVLTAKKKKPLIYFKTILKGLLQVSAEIYLNPKGLCTICWLSLFSEAWAMFAKTLSFYLHPFSPSLLWFYFAVSRLCKSSTLQGNGVPGCLFKEDGNKPSYSCWVTYPYKQPVTSARGHSFVWILSCRNPSAKFWYYKTCSYWDWYW